MSHPGYGHPAYSTQLVSVQPPRTSTAHVVVAWVMAVFTALYLLPWAVAATRGKRNIGPIVLINIFLGWSLVGWVAALVMACLNDDRPATLIIYGPPGPAVNPYAQPSPSPLPVSRPPVPQLPASPTGGYWHPASQPTASDEPTRPIDLSRSEDPYGPRWH